MFGIKKDNEFSKCCSAPVKRSPKIDINGLDLYDLLGILKNKEITIIELSENTQSLFEGNSAEYNCGRVKYEVLKFEKVIYDESYMITVRNLTS